MDKTQNIRQNDYENENKCPYSLCLRDFEHEEIIKELELDNPTKKHVCILNLTTLKDQPEADKLISNLTGQDGKIREVVALRIGEFLREEKTLGFFQNRETLNKIVNAICDINPNVSRVIVDSLFQIKDKKYLIKKILEKTYDIIDEIGNFDGKKNYELNRKKFNLYWLLKSLNRLFTFVDEKNIEQIISKTHVIKDYPIREETAKILLKTSLKTQNLKNIKEILKSDDNFYVKNVFIV